MEQHHQQQFLWFKIDDLALRFVLIGLALVIALFVVVGTCLICCWRRRKKRQQRPAATTVARLQKVPKITVDEAFSVTGLPADPTNVKVKHLFGPATMDDDDTKTVTNAAATAESIIINGRERSANLSHDSPLPPLNGGADYLDISGGDAPFSNIVILNGHEGRPQQRPTADKQLYKNGGRRPTEAPPSFAKNGVPPQKWSQKDRPFTILISDEEIDHRNHRSQAIKPSADLSNRKNGQPLNKDKITSISTASSPVGSTKRFVTKMAKVTESENEQIYGEFEALNQSFLSTIRPRRTTEAEMPENIRKNRFYDILPFEFNRVTLHWTNNAYGGTDGKSDYINASYIRAKENGPIHCIAAQGPITESEAVNGRRIATVRDFWEMVWQEGIDCIVMLDGTDGKQSAAEYWPEAPGETVPIGDDFSLHLYCVTDDEICVQREIWMERKGISRRKVLQWHFRQWPGTTAARIEALLEFVQTVRSSTKRTPFLVHCSAGVGRTGVFIALDLLLDKLQKEQIIDVKETVAWLRTQRIAMVQNAEQYVTIYEAIAMAIRRKSRH